MASVWAISDWAMCIAQKRAKQSFLSKNLRIVFYDSKCACWEKIRKKKAWRGGEQINWKTFLILQYLVCCSSYIYCNHHTNIENAIRVFVFLYYFDIFPYNISTRNSSEKCMAQRTMFQNEKRSCFNSFTMYINWQTNPIFNLFMPGLCVKMVNKPADSLLTIFDNHPNTTLCGNQTKQATQKRNCW